MFFKLFSIVIPFFLGNYFNGIVKAEETFKDEFLENIDRPELFKLTDFNIPTFSIELNDYDYKMFFYAYECDKDTSPNFVKRNEHCYTAPWVNLNEALKKCINKKYIDKNKVTNENDRELINNVVERNSYNITLQEFEKLIVSYTKYSLEEIFTYPYDLAQVPLKPFETSEATLYFELNGQKEKYENIKFSVGGRSTKSNHKLGYNINIKKGLLHEAKQIRLRAESVDPTFIRDKLAYDVYSILGLPTLSANYAKLYINNRYMGFYLFRDAFKSQWVEYNFGEKKSKHLYSCDDNISRSPFFNCVNDDTEVQDEEWNKFIQQLENSKSRADLEKFFDVDTYIRWQVSRYLVGSWDHPTNAQNNVLYMFHNKEDNSDKWIPLLYDFDMNFGCRRAVNLEATFEEEVVDKNNPLYKLLDLNDSSPEVRRIMDEYMRKVVNPMTLLPRIDSIKSLIEDYVYEDRTPDENGHRPGRFDRLESHVEEFYDYKAFMENTEFTTIRAQNYITGNHILTGEYKLLGMKHWIIERFRFICSHYNLDCSYAEEFLNSPYASKYSVQSLVYKHEGNGCSFTDYSCCVFERGVYSIESGIKWGVENSHWCVIEDKCWSKELGYDCCQKPDTRIDYSDSQGEWGVENGHWCGITDLQKCPQGDEYKCCSHCEVYSTDKNNVKWGIEHGDWCSIPYTCY